MKLLANASDNLVLRLRNNDEAAYHELVEQFGDRMLHLAYIIVKDRQVAEDVVQETFISLYQKLHTFSENSSLFTWIARICLNKAKNKVRPGFFNRITYLWEMPFRDSQPLPSEIYEHKETKQLLQQIVLDLPLKYRDTLYLYYYEDLSVKDIADLLDVSESAIKSRLQRGRDLVKHMLIERGWKS